MTAAGRRALSQAAALILIVVGLFALFEGPVRGLEAILLGSALRRLPGAGDIIVVGSSIIMFPDGRPFVRAVLLPSCSSFAPLLAMLVLWPLVPAGQRRRRAVKAMGAGMTVIVAGNFLRLLSSLAAGRWLGDAALVAFHDTVGAAFSYVYVVAGLLVGLRTMLPASSPGPDRARLVPAEVAS